MCLHHHSEVLVQCPCVEDNPEWLLPPTAGNELLEEWCQCPPGVNGRLLAVTAPPGFPSDFLTFRRHPTKNSSWALWAELTTGLWES